MHLSLLLGSVASALLLTSGTGVAPGGEAREGVTDTTILLGQSCALKGPAAGLGLGMSAGLEVAFGHLNANGGVAGRQIELKSLNDSYEPDKCQVATETLIQKAGVFLMIGEVGTPTSKVAVPICEEAKVPFVAPFTGAEFLREPFKRYVVNVRASYYQEMERLAELLVDQKGFDKIACFYQNDGYGQAGLSGIKIALESRGLALCAEGTYERNTVAVAQGLESIAASKPQAVVMVGAYKPCAAFIRAGKQRAETKDSVYCNISFVGANNLLSELGDASEGCIVSQVVPFPWDESVPLVAEYKQAMHDAGRDDEVGFISLEGYMAGKLFGMVFEAIDGAISREAFLDTVGRVGTFDLGGIELKFGPEDHQGMDEVWLTVFKGGKVEPLR